MFKKATDLTLPTPARQDTPLRIDGRSERRGKTYSLSYVEPLNDARTKLEDFFNILLRLTERAQPLPVHSRLLHGTERPFFIGIIEPSPFPKIAGGHSGRNL